MNSSMQAPKLGIFSSSVALSLIERLKRLSKKLSSLGYSKTDISQIILKTFLDLPAETDWLNLKNTDMYYSLKTKIEFKLEDSQLILTLSKCFLTSQEETEELAKNLINKLQSRCQALGFDLDNQQSGSSQDSNTFLQIYKNKLTKKYKYQNDCQTKRPKLRSKSKPQIKKRVFIQQAKPKKKIVQQEPMSFPALQKKQKKEDEL